MSVNIRAAQFQSSRLAWSVVGFCGLVVGAFALLELLAQVLRLVGSPPMASRRGVGVGTGQLLALGPFLGSLAFLELGYLGLFRWAIGVHRSTIPAAVDSGRMASI
jgi:hypothetical protein